jgi:thiosulfate/3-mercaptopyruvate sulfurtransferase
VNPAGFWKNRFRTSLIAAWIVSLLLPVAVATGAQAQGQPATQTQLLVSTDWLAGQLNDPGLVIVHVARTPDAYNAGHIPGARFLSRAEVGNDQGALANELPPVSELIATVQRLGINEKSRVVIYEEAAGLDASRVFVAFDYMGFGDRTALLDGQWKKWKAENRPVSTETPRVAASTWTPKVRPDLVVNLAAVRELSMKAKDPGSSVSIVDARPEVQYSGEQTPNGMRAGHIPGSQCVFWQANIASPDNPVLRPVAELRQLYKDVKAGPDKTVVTYCNSGGQASFAYYALRYLGYNVRLYDGSMQDWSRSPDAPLEVSR